jgi:hypothetical protein
MTPIDTPDSREAPPSQDYDAQLQTIYREFASSQKTLDHDFATLLADNLWALYAR